MRVERFMKYSFPDDGATSVWGWEGFGLKTPVSGRDNQRNHGPGPWGVPAR